MLALQVGAVVVGFDKNINYYKIQYACLCIRENPGCLFIATNLDAVTHLTDAQEWAGNGAMVGAIKGIFISAVMHFITLHCTVLVMHFNTLHCTVLVMHFTTLHCTVLLYIAVQYCYANRLELQPTMLPQCNPSM